MSGYEYSGYISFGFWVDSDTPLTKQEIVDRIGGSLRDLGVYEYDLGDIDHYIDGELQEEPWQE